MNPKPSESLQESSEALRVLRDAEAAVRGFLSTISPLKVGPLTVESRNDGLFLMVDKSGCTVTYKLTMTVISAEISSETTDDAGSTDDNPSPATLN